MSGVSADKPRRRPDRRRGAYNVDRLYLLAKAQVGRPHAVDASMDTVIEDPSRGEAVRAAPASAARPPLSFRDMRLKVGDRVQLEPPAHAGAGRVTARTVGWVEGQSLILTVPQTPGGKLCLQAGETVVVRVFTGRSAFAFGATVLRGTTKVSDYLHLSFPDAIDGVDVRSSPRFRLCLPAKAAADGAQPVDATIDNIGSTGALVVCAEPLGAIGGRIELAFDLELHKVPMSLALQAEIRTVEEAGASVHRHGVSFSDPSPNDRLVLAALVWFNMYENPKLSA
jgi:hypothetical protein